MPNKENWEERLRELYLHKTPTKDEPQTRSITYLWGEFMLTTRTNETPFYLATQSAIEDFIKSLLNSQLDEIEKEIIEKSKAPNISSIAHSKVLILAEETAYKQALIDLLQVIKNKREK